MSATRSSGEPVAAADVEPVMTTTQDMTPGPRAIDLTNYDAWDALVIRTNFSDDAAWQGVAAELQRSQYDFPFSFHLLDDPAWRGASADDVLAELPPEHPPVVFIADATAMRGDHALLAVRTTDEAPDDPDGEYEAAPGQFRLLPAAIAEVHVNLELANMDFDDFSWAAQDDADTIFRGFL